MALYGEGGQFVGWATNTGQTSTADHSPCHPSLLPAVYVFTYRSMTGRSLCPSCSYRSAKFWEKNSGPEPGSAMRVLSMWLQVAVAL